MSLVQLKLKLDNFRDESWLGSGYFFPSEPVLGFWYFSFEKFFSYMKSH